jgi:hypothetical protein
MATETWKPLTRDQRLTYLADLRRIALDMISVPVAMETKDGVAIVKAHYDLYESIDAAYRLELERQGLAQHSPAA